MQSLTSLIETTIITSRSELKNVLFDLNTIIQQLNLIQTAITGTSDTHEIHNRLNTIRAKALYIQSLIAKAIS